MNIYICASALQLHSYAKILADVGLLHTVLTKTMLIMSELELISVEKFLGGAHLVMAQEMQLYSIYSVLN